MERRNLILTGLLISVITVSGCSQTQLNSGSDDGSITGQLIGTASDKEVTEESPGEITLNARNLKNETSTFYVKIKPSGDYDKIADVTDRDGKNIIRVDLGEAVGGATTGEKFVEVRKDANITSTVKVKAELYREGEENGEPLDKDEYKLNMLEE